MKLKRYKVTNFKSVKDSGWIECQEITTLVGINEAGKSNLLLALWKLNPASGGEIDVTKDAPVSELNHIRTHTQTTPFITAEFELDENDNNDLTLHLDQKISDIKHFTITRYYDGEYEIKFDGNGPELIHSESPLNEDENKEDRPVLDKEKLNDILLDLLPKFVYYSNYGNLNTRLYLPHVIKWLKGEDIKGIDRNEEQIRTMRVLFQFGELDPEEIMNLGLEPQELASKRANGRDLSPSAEDITKARENKEERKILLNSAATKLTTEFHDWWRQGDYTFDFTADGHYFTIWVSDDKRKSRVGLEQRSTGLQWFLSFYLVFLVESQYSHKNTILLLDEAGLTLHPNAQKDLRIFFNELSMKNQIIHTTHSPFIVDTDNIDRCKVVYVDKNGFTVASSNLRENGDKQNNQSIYAVHAALGLSISDVLFQGCKPIIVEGFTDQIYLSAIKQLLIANKELGFRKELIFVPSGGVKNIPIVSSLLGGKKGELPIVFLDSDESGKNLKSKLINNNYTPDLIFEVGDFVKIPNAEIEDLIPFSVIEISLNQLLGYVEDTQFSDVYDRTQPIVPQIEKYAQDNSIELEPNQWKSRLAKMVKTRLLKSGKLDDKLSIWKTIFEKFNA